MEVSDKGDIQNVLGRVGKLSETKLGNTGLLHFALFCQKLYLLVLNMNYLQTLTFK